MSEHQKLQHFIGGEAVEPSSGEYFDSTNPGDPRGALPGRPRIRRRRRHGRRLGPADLRGPPLARSQPDPPRASPAPPRRPHRPERRRAGQVGVRGQRQAAAKDARPAGNPARVLPVLRRSGRQGARQHHPHLGPPSAQLHHPRAARRRRRYHPLELAADPDRQQARPCLCAGNTVVIKPSEYTSATVLRLAELAVEAGFPPGAVNVVSGFGAEAGAALVEHPPLAKISFTGSTATGARIASSAAGRFIGSTLELGGKSPNLVFDDANAGNAAMGVVAGIFAAAGQTCIAGSRVFAHRSVYDELLERVTERARSIRIGDPLKDDTELGPLAFEDQRQKASYVDLGRTEGARVLTGGQSTDGGGLGGYFYEPTVLVDVHNDMRVVREEIFGPVAAIMPFNTEDEVIRLANDTEYGLAAGVWTSNLSRAHRVAARLEAGTIWVNTYRAMSPMSPRQGFKNSGVGIEHGPETIKEYTRLKSVWINTSEEPVADPFIMRS